MYRVLPFVFGASSVLADWGLPVEMWVVIFRLLDPKSLLAVMKSNPLWCEIIKGDPVLRQTAQQQLQKDKNRRQQEILNPGRLIQVSRSGPSSIYATNGTKTIRTKPRTAVHHDLEAALDVNNNKWKGKMATKRPRRDTKPYKTLRL